MPTPTVPQGKGRETDSFNDFLRYEFPEYREKLRAMGVNPDAPIRLSGSQRAEMERFVRERFPDLPGKFQIDPAGNVNTDHGLSTAWSNPYFRTALIAGGTLGVGMAVAPAAFGIGAGGSGAAASTGAASAAGVGGATAAGGGASAAMTAAGGGGIWGTIGRFASNPLVQQGVQSGLGYLQNRQNIAADDRRSASQDQYLREALEYERGRDALEDARYADERDYSRRTSEEERAYGRAWDEDERGYRRGQFDRELTAFQPYEAAGSASIARLSDLLGQPAQAPPTAESVMASGRVPAPSPDPRFSGMTPDAARMRLSMLRGPQARPSEMEPDPRMRRPSLAMMRRAG